jgi:hypothetical protein
VRHKIESQKEAKSSVVKAEGWSLCQSTGVTAIIGTSGEVVSVALNSWVFAMGEVRDREEVGRGDHPGRHTGAELLDLSTDVVKEGVTRPSSEKHDGKDGDACQVHSHGGTRADGVGADLVGLKTQLSLTDV